MLSDNAQAVLRKRYFTQHENELPVEEAYSELCKRVANFVAKDILSANAYVNIMRDQLFLPNSPCLMGAGTDMPQLFACFVLPVGDSIESIFDAVKNAALIHKSGGGTGFSFSELRPTDAYVRSTHGVASGPVSFMKIFNAATEQIKQGGRRKGANMGVLRADHPDIHRFINAKWCEGDLNNFNISVAFPQLDGYSDVLDAVAEKAWYNGEPGCVFLRNIRVAAHPSRREAEATNPCVTGDTLLLTEDGHFPIEELVGKTVRAWNGSEFSSVQPFSTGVNPVLEVKLSNGVRLSCTPYHKFILASGERCEAKDLTLGDKLTKHDLPVIKGTDNTWANDGYSQGFYAGDGTVGRNNSPVYGPKYPCIPRLCGRITPYDEGRVRWLHGSMYPRDAVPVNADIDYCLEWLAGVLDADGCATKDGVQLSASNKAFLDSVQMMLTRLGVSAKISKCRGAKYRDMPDGKGGMASYYCKEQWRLLLKVSDIVHLRELGLITNRVEINNYTINRSNAARFVVVEEVNYIGEDETFCATEPKNHSLTFNGVVTGQCGEFPAMPYEPCVLGSINLAKFVREDGSLDERELVKTARYALRFLDDCIDASHYPLAAVEKAAKYYRSTGLGMMGLADALFKAGLPYNSTEGRAFAARIAEVIQKAALYESKFMAISRGPAPASKDCGDVSYVRNVARTAVAPTGTLSLIANCSPGIEPVYSIVTVRNVMDGMKLREYNPYCEAQMKREGVSSPEELSPAMRNVFVTAMDIPAIDHVLMQAKIQKHVDHAVSKTINLPHHATVQDVRGAFEAAYRLGCKGVTVYRDGSRDEQVYQACSLCD